MLLISPFRPPDGRFANGWFSALKSVWFLFVIPLGFCHSQNTALLNLAIKASKHDIEFFFALFLHFYQLKSPPFKYFRLNHTDTTIPKIIPDGNSRIQIEAINHARIRNWGNLGKVLAQKSIYIMSDNIYDKLDYWQKGLSVISYWRRPKVEFFN